MDIQDGASVQADDLERRPFRHPSGTQPEAELSAKTSPDRDILENVSCEQNSTKANSIVERSLRDLIDDWHRKGQKLSYDDVTRVSTKRDLDGMQLAYLLEGLRQYGIEIIGIDNAESIQSPPVDGDGDDGQISAGSSAERDTLRAYLQEIGRYPLIYAEDEVRLGRLIRSGLEADRELERAGTSLIPHIEAVLHDASDAGRRAHADLVRSNLRLVVSIARKYVGSGLDMLDLIQEGNLGLLHAADLFDYSFGYKFSTYATWWIRQAIMRGIANQSRVIRLPVHIHEKVVQVLRARRKLSERLDHEPTLADMVDYLQMESGEIQAVLDWARPAVSLDMPIGEDGDLTLGDLLAADIDIDGRTDPLTIVLTAARQRDIARVIKATLNDRSMYIIQHRYGLNNNEPETLETIGKRLGITRERVRQIETEATKALASSPASRELYEYLVDQTKRAEVRPPNGWPVDDKKPRRRRQPDRLS